MALCLSIFLEAIQRIFEPQIVSNPFLVLIVGSLGLLSNIFGLFLFHEHGHSHNGENDHAHSSNKLADVEEGNSQRISFNVDTRTQVVADESGNIADVLPQSAVGGWSQSLPIAATVTEASQKHKSYNSGQFNKSDEDDSTAANSTSPVSTRKAIPNDTWRHRRHTSSSRSRFANAEDIQIHPVRFRNDIIAAGRLEDIGSTHTSGSEDEEPTEESPLVSKTRSHTSRKSVKSDTPNHKQQTSKDHDSWHEGHKHEQGKKSSQGGHSHGDLNMRGVLLHVIGDALGNIGVIGSGLFIWLTSYSWRFYADPAISLLITVVILGSAVPLCKAASRILLQAVPAGINVDEIKEDIEGLPGILSCHHLHVWQLSDTKLVASLHIQLEYDFKGEGSARYMKLAREVRRCLHEYGIHNPTIQPEFCLDGEHRPASRSTAHHEGLDSRRSDGSGRKKGTSRSESRVGSIHSEPETCLLECGDECDERGQCCAPSSAEIPSHDDASHSH